MILKEIAHKVAQAFRLAQATDKKLSTGIAAALDAKADRREDEPVRIKYQIQTLRKGEKRWQKLRSGREAKTKPEASC